MSCRFPWLTSVLLSLLVAPVITPFASANDAQWIEVQSPHFSVVTDAGEKRGRETAMRFEQMRAAFGALLLKANLNSPVPLQIVAFRNTKELQQFSPLWNGKPVQLAGLFQAGEDRSFIMLDMSVENPWTVVFHEYAHQLMNGVITATVDPWFDEGFAEYFSSIEVDNKEVRIGKVPDYNYQILRQDGMMKVADLFRIQKNSPTYNESGNHRTVFYAESAMVMHYLYDNKQVGKLSQYFALKIDRNMPVEDAIQQAFGMSAGQFDKVLRDYISSGHYMFYSLPTPINIVSKDYQVKTLSVADRGAVLADVHLHSLDYHDQAIAEFQEILKTEPNHAAACRGLGYAYLQKRDYAQAGEYFKRAAQADSKDPRVHYYSALLMSREGAFTNGNRTDLPQMTSELETAIALDPGFADSYMLLAFAQAYAGDPAKGLVTMQKAVSLSPRNEKYQFNLAQMYLNNQKMDDAIAILQVLQKSGNPEVMRRADQTLAQAQQFKAMQADRATGSSSDLGDVASAAGTAIPIETSPRPEAVSQLPSQTLPKFLKGTIVSVDCSSAPSATLTVLSGTKTWKMHVSDSKHAVVIGADQFSCSWKKEKVGLNYRETGDATGNVVSIEVQ